MKLKICIFVYTYLLFPGLVFSKKKILPNNFKLFIQALKEIWGKIMILKTFLKGSPGVNDQNKMTSLKSLILWLKFSGSYVICLTT